MRSFKKIAAMIMAVAMLCSFTVLGASVEISEIALSGNVATITYDATDVDEVTALVYSGTSFSGANLVYIDQFEDGYEIPAIEAPDYGTYTVALGGTGVATADTDTFEYADTRVFYNVTVADTANGYIKTEADLSEAVLEGTEIELTFAPHIGYELESFTIGGEEKVAAATNGVYSYTYVAAGNVEIKASFKLIETAEEAGAVYTSAGIYDVTGEVDPENPKDAEASKLAFGKAKEVAGKVAKNMGMKVEVYDEEKATFVDFKTPAGVGPLFRATNPINNVYGIRFFGFAAGTYKVTSYVQYADAETGALDTEIYGTSVEFTVG